MAFAVRRSPFTVRRSPFGGATAEETRTEDTEDTEDFLAIGERLPCRFSPTMPKRKPFSLLPDLRDLRVLRASLPRGERRTVNGERRTVNGER
jgi:hypothetical protein